MPLNVFPLESLNQQQELDLQKLADERDINLQIIKDWMSNDQVIAGEFNQRIVALMHISQSKLCWLAVRKATQGRNVGSQLQYLWQRKTPFSISDDLDAQSVQLLND